MSGSAQICLDWTDADPQDSYMFCTHRRTRLEDLKWPSRIQNWQRRRRVGLWSRLECSPFFSIGVKPSFFRDESTSNIYQCNIDTSFAAQL